MSDILEDSAIATRLKAIIEALGLSDSQFADRSGISRPTLSLLLSGKNKKISDVMLSQIHKAYPEVSILWLLFGEGEIFKQESSLKNEGENLNENPIFSGNHTNEEEQLNLVNVNQLEKIIQDVVNKSFESSLSSLHELILKINEPINLRKVSNITVYYDDSTFETFISEK